MNGEEKRKDAQSTSVEKENPKQGIKSEFGNTNSKDIWQNELLCAQFLPRYAKVSLLENVQPEDIEDITEELRPFVGVEYEGDSVKQIHLREAGNRDVFVVGLLEHKSDVDYDVTFQLLKYMVGIWEMHQKREDRGKRYSRNKGFRYPLIIPIVYYEGKESWTAGSHWKDRVEFSDVLGKYVPDFTYEVVSLHNYTKEELLSMGEELSLVLMLNRAQTEDDLDFGSLPKQQRAVVDKIIHDAPNEVVRILAQMVHHFGLKMKVPDEKLREYVKSVEERDMGELWANMDEIDLPKRLREITEMEQAAAEKMHAADEREQKLAEREQKLSEREQAFIEKEHELAELRRQLEEYTRTTGNVR